MAAHHAFTWTAHLSSGGMSEVFAGVHRATHLPMVLKTWAATRAPLAMPTFFREAQAVARLLHRNIVRVRDFGTWDEAVEIQGVSIASASPFVIMDRVMGETLSAHIGQRTLPDVCVLAQSLLKTLAHIHARQIIHRDLKPDNIVLNPSGEPVIIDFGLADLFQGDASSRGGTPLYLAPEQLHPDSGYGQGPWTDLHALGCVLHEVLTGQPPFLATSHEQLFDLKQTGQRTRALDDVAPPVFVSWMDRLLAAQPEDRYLSAAHAHHALCAMMPFERLSALTTTPPQEGAHSEPMMLGESSFLDVTSSLPLIAPAQEVQREVRLHPGVSRQWSRPRQHKTEALSDTELGIFSLKATPIVARVTEQSRLWDVYAGGSGQRALALVGQAGVGKSALARSLMAEIYEQSGVVALRVSFSATESDARSWSRALQSWFGVVGLSAEALSHRLRRRLLSIGIVSTWTVSLIESFVSNQGRRAFDVDRLVRALNVLARAYSRPDAPWLIVLDDAHESITARTIASLCMAQSPQLDVVWVMTARTSPTEPFDVEQTHAVVCEVPRLDDHAMAGLLKSTLKFKPDVVSHLCERADGNPLYALQLLKTLVERGALIAFDDGFGWAPQTEIPMPQVFYDLCLTRLADVERGEGPEHEASLTRFLETFALLGAVVSREEWRKLCLLCEVPNHALEQLFLREIIREDDGEFAFEHGMLRESLIHRAEHAGRASMWRRACIELIESTSLRFIDSRLRLFQLALAVQDFDRAFLSLDYVTNWQPATIGPKALEQITLALGPTPALHHQLSLCLSCLSVEIGVLSLANVDELVEQARALNAQLGERVTAEQYGLYHLCLGYLAYLDWSLAEAIELSECIISEGVSTETQHSGHKLLIQLYALTEDIERAQWHSARARETLPEGAWSSGWLNYALLYVAEVMNDHDEMARLLDSSMALFHSCHDLTGIASITHGLGNLALLQGRYEQSAQHYHDAIEIYQQCGDGGVYTSVESLIRVRLIYLNTDEGVKQLLEMLEQGDALKRSFDVWIPDLYALYWCKQDNLSMVAHHLNALICADDEAYVDQTTADALSAIEAHVTASAYGIEDDKDSVMRLLQRAYDIVRRRA